MKTIGRNRMRLGICLLLVVVIGIVAAAFTDNGTVLTAVVSPAFVAFGALLGIHDEGSE